MQNHNIFIFIIGVLVVVAGFAIAKKRQTKTTHNYESQKPLTKNEQAMYWKLAKALPEHAILPQVAMSSFIRSGSQATRATISQKSVDFLICDRSFNIVAAIEIDDKSHERTDRKKADKTKNEAFEKAGLRLIRWRSTPLPDASEIVRTVTGEKNEKHEIS